MNIGEAVKFRILDLRKQNDITVNKLSAISVNPLINKFLII